MVKFLELGMKLKKSKFKAISIVGFIMLKIVNEYVKRMEVRIDKSLNRKGIRIEEQIHGDEDETLNLLHQKIDIWEQKREDRS